MRNIRQNDIKFLTPNLACGRGRVEGWDCFHQHNEVELMLVREGTLVYRFSGETKVIPSGNLACFWSSLPHQIVASGAPPFLEWATAPLGLFLQWRLPEAFSREILMGRMVVEPVLDGDRGRFVQWEQDLARHDESLNVVVKLELEARFRRLALAFLGGAAAGQAARPPLPPGGLGRIERANLYIAANFERDIGVKDIAAAAGVCPNYLVGLYRRHCGLGVVDFVAALRVAKAQRLLATTSLKVGAVAFESGFGSVNAFYRAFWKTTGLTPSAFRCGVVAP